MQKMYIVSCCSKKHRLSRNTTFSMPCLKIDECSHNLVGRGIQGDLHNRKAPYQINYCLKLPFRHFAGWPTSLRYRDTATDQERCCRLGPRPAGIRTRYPSPDSIAVHIQFKFCQPTTSSSECTTFSCRR